MRIIHTSDWHIGHSLYGYDRSDEQKAALKQIEELVREKNPDALVVSGDIYDSPQPSSYVQTFFTEAIMRMHAASPKTAIIITAGNHDSGTKHEISKVLWETQNVYMIGTIDKGDVGEQIIELPGIGYIIAVPYCSERHIPDGFWQGLLDEVESRNKKELPVVLSAHLTVSGSDFKGHESVRENSVGGIDSIEIEELGKGYDYVALGHIHRPQTLKGSDGRIRYSGTPIPISFDETYPHTVSIVEIESHGSAPHISEIPIENPSPLVTLPSEGFAPWDDVKQLAVAFPKDNPAYIRLNVEVEDILPPDAQAEARSIFIDGNVKFCLVNSKRKIIEQAGRKTMSVSEFKAMEPFEVAKLFAEESGRVFDEELEKLFKEVEKEVNDGLRNE